MARKPEDNWNISHLIRLAISRFGPEDTDSIVEEVKLLYFGDPPSDLRSRVKTVRREGHGIVDRKKG
jgi:hypothetical protein